MKTKAFFGTALAVIFLSAHTALAEVKLASPFTSHMVLQREKPVPVWGTADPNEQVTVEFAGQKKTVTAGADGHWRVDLDPLKASAESRTLVVRGEKTAQPLTLEDVLVGEVWVGSGQSNMEFTVSKKRAYFAGVTNEEQEIADANHPLVRMFTGVQAKTYLPQQSVGGEWLVCTPETVPGFSAVGYFFARDLSKELNVPVGILLLAYGASTAEAWIPREALAADSKLQPFLDRFDAAVKSFDATNSNRAQLLEDQKRFAEEDKKARAAGQRPARHARNPDPVQDQHNATVLFNGMIHPVIPFAIRGVIWYQGESIVGGAEGRALYPQVQSTLVREWRRLWSEGDFPFYIVQLAALQNNSNHPDVREAQATVLALPNTGMAVTIDIGDPKDVHPHNKKDVGDRLTRIGLANAYGRNVEYSGPMYESMTVEGTAIRLKFSHASGGLVARDGALKTFEIAGADKKYLQAEAVVDGDSILVRNTEVTSPVAAHYAWSSYPEGCNLYNTNGLPAAPFRTDAPAHAAATK